MTKTDSLDWNEINPGIKFSYTRKKFFNEFYFRLNYLVSGARLVTYNPVDDPYWHHRIDNYNNVSFYSIRRQGERANHKQILDFARVYHCEDHPHKLKFRIEADQLSIYSNSEEYLYEIADTYLADWKSEILSVSLIENEKDRLLLDQGYIIASRPQSHPYRVKIKETFGFQQERKCLKTYLQNLGDSAKVTKYMLGRLAHEHKYFPGGYIYVNDSRLIDMLHLVSPNLIGSVQQLVTQQI